MTIYRFNFDLGVPVFAWPEGKTPKSYRWRKSHKTIKAYSLNDAIRRLCKPIVEKYGWSAKLHVTDAYSKDDINTIAWTEISVDETTLTALLVGMQERELLNT